MSVQDKINQLKELHKKGVVKGLKDVSGVLPRKDIDVMMKEDPLAFTLFLHAFKALKETKADDIMGYYQIAGIHGLPLALWDNVSGPLLMWDSEKNRLLPNIEGKVNKHFLENGGRMVDSGYCSHAVETFPTWHRPYLTMLEQSLFLQMMDLIEKAEWTSVDKKNEYLEAALTFRLPWWDYFRSREQIALFPGPVSNGKTTFPYNYRAPLILTTPNIKVRTLGTDKIDDMENPLLSFKFPNEEINGNLQKARFTLDQKEKLKFETRRYLDKDDPVQAFSDVLNSFRMDLNRVMLNMLSDEGYADYDIFATNRKNEKIKTHAGSFRISTDDDIVYASGSLEALHNLYHGLIGGYGHMSRVPVATFDPIFWVHHGQIERIFSLWQAIHAKDEKNWFVGDKVKTMADDGLYPFRKSPGNTKESFWTSNDSISTEAFGYTYPEITNSKGSKDDLIESIKKMYDWSVKFDSKQKNKPPENMVPIDVLKETEFFGAAISSEESKKVAATERLVSSDVKLAQHQELLLKTEEAQPSVTDKKYSYEWFVDDEVQRLAADGTFTIYYFINNQPNASAPPVEGNTLLLEPTIAGATHIFAAPTSACDNCGRQDQQAVVVTNTNAITSMLLDYAELGQLQSLTPEHVEPFLKERLRWRMDTVSGDKLDPRMMHSTKGFNVNVSLKKAKLPRGSGDVQYFEYPQIVSHIISQASPQADSH